ncbi:MAG: DUF6153 family protein [Actinomycetota bacterium]|nr:DUF6153 family protein [Actinomycetota bacterium]
MTDGERAAVGLSRFVAPRRRLLITLVAVPSILIGLLAMHFLAGADEVASTSMGMSASAVSTVTSAMTDVAGSDCADACLTSHDMTMSMACVLALLVTVIILTLLLIFARRDPELLNRLLSQWRARIASLPPPLPPSLHVLSISRI